MDEDEYVGDDDSDTKSPSALDFYDIDELCEDNGSEGSNASSSDEFGDNSDITSQINSIVPIFNDDFIIPGRPLSSVLPKKYLDTDVKQFFPEFREGKVLRFQRLFGIGKPSNMPDIWKSVRKMREIEKSRKKSPKKGEETRNELEVESDEELKFLTNKVCTVLQTSGTGNLDNKKPPNIWRFGPAQLWYDMVSLPEDAETFDYGFKERQSNNDNENSLCEEDIPDESYLMVSQDSWEDSVIWDGDDVKEEVLKNLYCTEKAAGWIPVGSDRTVESYNERVSSSQNDSTFKFLQIRKKISNTNVNEPKGFRSMFSEDNLKLLCDRWEDDVIWDSDAMERISYPKPLEIHDYDLILQIPDDESPPPSETPSELSKDLKDRRYRPSLKSADDDDDDTNPVSNKQNFYNISNDEYYNPKLTQDAALKLSTGGSLLQHSIPAVELRAPYFPTHMGPLKLRRFHRPALKQYSHGPLSQEGFHGVYSLIKHIRHKSKQRLKELEESGGGEMFFMRTAEDLSSKDGELVLFEFSEEHPPLMMQVGMASKIRNYYRRKPGKDTTTTIYKYGETAYTHTSPFLGSLQPGQSLQAYENNLFRSPIYEHTVKDTDFLIIRTRYKYYIREVEIIYSVGQELPLMEVPAPKSEKANNFVRDFLMIFIYRQFWNSPDIPRKIKMEDIRKAFPSLREFSIRKRLNLCAEFQRTGFDSKFWVLKTNFRLPTEDEIRQMISPEQCCAYYCMLAAEQRLKDAGYGDKYQLMADEETDELQNKIDDEIKAAPWNTSQAFISAIRGKCNLELYGAADPTGCGEGFSFAKVPSKPQWLKDECNLINPAKRIVKGTDADLRRLSLSNAKKFLRTFNVPDHEIKKMTRWQIVDVVRTLSTERAKLGEESNTKFARGNFFSQAEHHRKYKEECQRLFDLQNRVLASEEVLSTDEESSSEDESDLEEMGKHLESILSNKKSAKDLTHECEEAQRKELQKLMSGDSLLEDSQKNKVEKNESSMEGKILKIFRTYKNNDGSEFVRVETVRRAEVIELYTKIRDTKNGDFIRNYALDEAQKEEIRREKRRLQDQLRRIKRNEMREKTQDYKEPPKKKIKLDSANIFKVKCGACGATGHMRTNKACPLYQTSSSLPPVQVAMTEEQEEAEEKAGLDDQNLIKLDETKLILSKTLLKHADEVRRKSLVLKIPKDLFSAKKKRNYDMNTSDYLSAPKFVNRKRIDPVVSICVIFENLLTELKNLRDTQPFWFPVSSKIAPDYHIRINKPMDLNTMKEKVRNQQYKSREDFLTDLTQILENSKVYNGPNSYLSITAQTMVDHCIKCFSEKEEKLMQLEKSINPLLDDDQVAFSFMLDTIVNEQLKTVTDSWPFHKPVDKRVIKNYYEVIKTPMDLDLIVRNCKANKYKTRAEFVADVTLLYTNSLNFNGPNNQFTKIAQQIVETCNNALDMYKEQLEKYELGIKAMNKNDSSVDENSLTPNRTKRIKKYNQIKSHDSPEENISNTKKSVNLDSFVDVESFDASPQNSVDKDNISVRSDYEVDVTDTFKAQESNSVYSYSPVVDYDQRSHDSASPTYFSQSQSLFPVNGVHNVDSIDNSHTEITEPFTQSTCDIIDDLMLSESSDEDVPVDDELKF